MIDQNTIKILAAVAAAVLFLWPLFPKVLAGLKGMVPKHSDEPRFTDAVEALAVVSRFLDVDDDEVDDALRTLGVALVEKEYQS